MLMSRIIAKSYVSTKSGGIETKFEHSSLLLQFKCKCNPVGSNPSTQVPLGSRSYEVRPSTAGFIESGLLLMPLGTVITPKVRNLAG